MNLTLEIVGPEGQSAGGARRKVFGPEGGRIGRSPDCDWVLPSPYISRHHATIRWISGTYYIESTGENGVAIGGPQAMLPKLERRALKNGDHLFIDEYEVVVGLDSVVGGPAAAPAAALSFGASTGALIPTDDPFAELGPTRKVRALSDPLEPAPEELDPLRRFGGPGASAVTTSPRDEASWNHTPGVSDQYTPPPVAQSGSTIPDDWDKTTFGRTKPSQPAAQPPPRGSAERASATPAIPDDWDKTSFGRKPPGPAPATPGPAAAAPGAGLGLGAGGPAPVRPGPAGARPAQSIPATMGTRPLERRAVPGAAAGAAPSPQWPLPSPPQAPAARASTPLPTGGPAAGAPQPASAPSGAQASFDVTAFLRSAGVDPATIPPDTADALGLILRSVVQGVIDVLRARAEIKEQFRLSQTVVKTAENNPLKFAVNAEDALGSLLGRRNPAYLPPVEAFEDAFDDIRFHQLAMLAGMRAGFDHVMSRFDPGQMQESFDKRARRGGLLSMSGKSRYWEQFTEEFQELAGDRERAFRRLFAEEFAAAYEKQLELLKRAHSKVRR